jgi:hypothetical protein
MIFLWQTRSAIWLHGQRMVRGLCLDTGCVERFRLGSGIGFGEVVVRTENPASHSAIPVRDAKRHRDAK